MQFCLAPEHGCSWSRFPFALARPPALSVPAVVVATQTWWS